MGGGKVKRRKVKRRITKRQHLEAWAWRNCGGQYIHVGRVKPVELFKGRLEGRNSTCLCCRVFKLLTGRSLSREGELIKVRIPPWTVVKAKR